MKHNIAIYNQLKCTEGVISYDTKVQNPYVYWTLTTWESKEAMMKFRNSGSHLQAMKEIRNIASKAESAHWVSETKPDWNIAREEYKRHLSSSYK